MYGFFFPDVLDLPLLIFYYIRAVSFSRTFLFREESFALGKYARPPELPYGLHFFEKFGKSNFWIASNFKYNEVMNRKNEAYVGFRKLLLLSKIDRLEKNKHPIGSSAVSIAPVLFSYRCSAGYFI